ncbi:MAG: hypothetical protein ABUJ93_06290, partial [Hyphomicrobium sp.]
MRLPIPLRAIMAAAFVLGLLMPANAQDSGNWSTDLELRGAFPAMPGDDAKTPPDNSAPTNTTVIPRTPTDPSAQSGTASRVKLIALLTADGQHIDNGIVWRVYDGANAPNEKSNLLKTEHT